MGDTVPLPEPDWTMPERMAGQWAIPGAWNAASMHSHAAAQSAADNAALRDELGYALTGAAIEAKRGDVLAQRVKVLEQLITDATYTLSKARIWNGMGWTYNPLHPIHYTPMRERLSNEADNIYAARAALERKP